ncbi:MAG: FG-GAP repeat protein [Myxococcota bacterium]
MSAPSTLVDAFEPVVPGRVYVLSASAPSGDLETVAPSIVGPDVGFGKFCVSDLQDLNGDSISELGVCGTSDSFVVPGPISTPTSVGSALARFERAPSGATFPFVLEAMVAGPHPGTIVVAASGVLATVEAPVGGTYRAPPGAGMSAVFDPTDSADFRGSGGVVVLEGRSSPTYAFTAIHPYENVGGIGVFDGWPASGDWSSAARWRAGAPHFSVFGVERGDVDDDGVEDVLVRNHTYNSVSVLTDPRAGGALDTAPMQLDGAPVDEVEEFGGYLSRHWFGSGVAVGDLDHDGVNDVVVGMPGNHYFDAPPGAFVVFLGPLEAREYTLEDADLIGHDSDTPNDEFGAVPVIADIDGDGWNELVVGSPYANAPDAVDAGTVTVYDDLFGPPPSR